MTIVSVVMPYWRRPAQLTAALKTYRRFYAHHLADGELEIVIVDDGSGDLPDVGGARVVTLPRKNVALNPCVPFNRGVAASTGEYVLLTNPEVVHRAPIIPAMWDECRRLGSNAYVAAACFNAAKGIWSCHSRLAPAPDGITRAPRPKNAGLHFCAMLSRAFYEDVGGFDEHYRDGQGYEDNDLLWTLFAAGAWFETRDDLITDHLHCERCLWPSGGLVRNRQIFYRKWQSWLGQPG